MALTPGTRLGPYEIAAPLGAGGMGEVYRARDTRLGRDVAMKVLRTQLSANPEVRTRFEREAKAISSLNHPNICVLHDVGREGDTDYLVMELVEGESLAERLTRGALPLGLVQKLGAEIADALAMAHRAGIVHRDLKPGNVMVTKNGVKLMDFGLARTLGMAGPENADAVTEAALSRSPTMSRPLTAEGTIVGTFQYMAPEQLEGSEPDARSDIWALGATLYEMTTGKRAFAGKSQASLISAIMKDEPRPLGEIAPLTPPGLDRVIRRCLAKDPDERWQSAVDIASELRWISGTGSAAQVAPRLQWSGRGRPRLATVVAATGWLVAIAAGAWIAASGGGHDEERPFHASITLKPPDTPVGVGSGPIALSPDGTRLATVVRRANESMVSVYDFSTGISTPLESTKGAAFPFWSPDGHWIGFFADERLKKVEASGGPAQTLVDAHAGRGASWSRAGVIVFAPDIRGGLLKVSENGGATTAVTQPGGEEITHRNPVFLPDGEHFFFIERKSRSEGVGRLMVGSISGSTQREILDRASNAQFASGYLLFVRDRSLLAQHFDSKRLALEGAIVPVAENVEYYNARDLGNFSASPSGLLAFRQETALEQTPVWLDRDGRLIETLGAAGRFIDARASRDLRELALTLTESAEQTLDIWVLDTTTKQMRRATFSNTPSFIDAAFSPDGRSLVVSSGNVVGNGVQRAGVWASSALWLQPVSGTRSQQTLVDSTDFQIEDWSPDGNVLIGWAQRTATGFDVTFMRLDDPKHEVHDLVKTSFNERNARFSSDGRWVLYNSDESGQSEVYILDFPAGSRKWQVSRNGGGGAIWSSDAREIFYRNSSDSLMAVPVATSGESLELGTPVRLGLSDARIGSLVASDGKRFLALQGGAEQEVPIQVVRNWTKMLKTR